MREINFHTSPRLVARTHERGFAMVIALFFIALLLVVVLVLLQATAATSTNAVNVQQKNQVFDGAEAGLNAAISALDQDPLAPNGCTTGSLTPYGSGGTSFSYQACVAANNFPNTTPTTASDPATGAMLSVPGGDALVYGSSSSSLTGQLTYAEAIVKAPGNGLSLPPSALAAAGNGTFVGTVTLNADNPPTNDDAAAIANGNFIEAGIVTVQGPMESHGSNTNIGIFSDTRTDTSQPPYAFPKSSQITAFANAAKTAAQSGTTMTPASFLSTCSVATACNGNIYVDGPITTSVATNVTINGTGTVYVDGDITDAGVLNFTNKNGATVIINGNVTGGGAFNYSVTPGITIATLMVLGSGSYTVAGIGQYVGVVYAPNGNITLAGISGITGQVAAGNDDTCNYTNGCGNVTNAGTFLINYMNGLTIGGPRAVKTLSYWEH